MHRRHRSGRRSWGRSLRNCCPECGVGLIADEDVHVFTLVNPTDLFNVHAVDFATAEVFRPQPQAAAAEDADFHDLRVAPDEFREMAVINRKVMLPFPDPGAFVVVLEVLPERIVLFGTLGRGLVAIVIGTPVLGVAKTPFVPEQADATRFRSARNRNQSDVEMTFLRSDFVDITHCSYSSGGRTDEWPFGVTPAAAGGRLIGGGRRNRTRVRKHYATGHYMLRIKTSNCHAHRAGAPGPDGVAGRTGAANPDAPDPLPKCVHTTQPAPCRGHGF